MKSKSKETDVTYVVRDVENRTVVLGASLARVVVDLRGEGIYVVGLPEADVYIERGRKRRDFHVVCPLAGLAHLLDVQVELTLQFLLGVVARIDASGQRGRLAFWVPARRVHGYVCAIELGICTHMSNRRVPQCSVFVLVTVELVTQCVEEAVTYFSQPEFVEAAVQKLTIAFGLAGIQAIGLEHGEFNPG